MGFAYSDALVGSENLNVDPDPFLAFDGHLSTVSLSKRLHDGETQARSTLVLRIGFSLLEDFFEKLFRNSGAVVADPALNGGFPRPSSRSR